MIIRDSEMWQTRNIAYLNKYAQSSEGFEKMSVSVAKLYDENTMETLPNLWLKLIVVALYHQKTTSTM